jgi:formate hydrogenlyase transcriptional activator
MSYDQTESKFEERLRFEQLLVDISSRFVNISIDEIDSAVKGTLGMVSEFLQVDRAGLGEYDGDETWIFLQVWTAPEFSPRHKPGEFYRTSDVPWIYNKILKGEAHHISSVRDIPHDQSALKDYFKEYRIKSELDIPLSISDSVLGVISFIAERSERHWSSSLIQRCKLIGQILAGVLLRKRAELELREAEFCYRTVADFTYDWEYWANRDGTMRYVSPSCERVTGYTRDELLSDPLLLDRMVVTADRDIWKRHICDNLDHMKAEGLQYRIQTRNKEICWIEHECRKVIGEDGEFLGIRANNRDITKRKESEEKYKDALVEIEQLKDQLQEENIYLKEEIDLKYNHDGIVGQSESIREVLNQIEQVAHTDSTVLLLGETGTGKELVARAIHNLSNRKDRPMIKVNCAALPTTLIENELFGREKGAYTGAESLQKGRFEIANKSTLFLDEIGDISLNTQVKLLRVLQESEFERIGSTKTIRTDVRIIAATNKDLAKAVLEGTFRKDLFYRLNVFPILIPPLRDRIEDIPLLIWPLVDELGKSMGKHIDSIPLKTIKALQNYAWPGNVRELRNCIERAMIMIKGNVLTIPIPETSNLETAQNMLLTNVERQHIIDVLETTSWRIQGKNGAAELLGLKRTTLNARMKKLGIRRPILKPINE